jgi:hypothetical protein
MRRFVSSPSRVSSFLLLSVLVSACGGGGGVGPLPPPFVVDAPVLGGGGSPPPGGVTPPPAPAVPPVWDAVAADLGRTAFFGSFPSDLVRFDGTFFTTDADAIEPAGARVLAFDATSNPPAPSPRYATVTIQAGDLRDSLGQPGSFANPIGFGFFLNDLVIVNERLGFVLANAGGSDSSPTLSNVVAFDPTTGALKQVVNLAQPFQNGGVLLDSSGAAAAGQTFVQAGAEALAFVATPTGGLLYVAMTNLIFGAPSFGAIKHRGTLQVFDVSPAAGAPVSVRPAAGLFTETLLTQDYNPIALSTFDADMSPGGIVIPRLLVTVGGTTAYNVAFQLVPVTEASVEVWDADALAFRGRFRLGLAGLAGTHPALGRDGAGHHVGFFPSSVTGEVYLLLVDGIHPWEIDVSQLAVLRGPGNGIPITAAQAGGPGGNVTGVGLSPDGRTLAVSGFGDLFAFPVPNPGQLVLLALPDDVVTGSGFGANFVPGSARYAAEAGRTLGSLLVRGPGESGPDIAVLVGGAIDLTTFLGTGPASLGTLQTFGWIH